jgi:hypothetical protein
MRTSKLITLTAAAILAGGANVALAETSLQSGSATHGSAMSHKSQGLRHGIAPSVRSGPYARANPRELGEAGNGLHAQERERRHEMMMRTLPRLSSVGTELRIDAIVPRSVRQAAAPLPAEIQRMHPRLARDRAFRFRDQVVIVNPATSRIVAIVKAPG